MKYLFHTVLVVALLELPTVAMADEAAPPADFSDSNATFTHDCSSNATVAFNSSSSKITVLGACDEIVINGASSKVSIVSAKKVVINGASNEVSIDAAGKISVTGSSNIVTYAKGLGKAKAPKVAKSGVGNKVSKRKVGKAN